MEEIAHPNPSLLWKHRRRMAYGGLVFSVIAWVVGLALGTHVEVELARSVVVPVTAMGFWGGLIPMGAYMGNCAVEEIAKVRKPE